MAKKSSRLKFTKGKKQSGFLDLLGVSYGVLTINDSKNPENSEEFVIIDPEKAKQWLQNGVELKNITKTEARKIEKEIKKTGLDSKAVILDKARKFPIPKNHSSSFCFKACTSPSCPQPLPHGNILTKSEGSESHLVTGPILVLTTGLRICEDILGFNKDKQIGAVVLFQEMIKADLPFDDKDWDDRYKDLPKEIQNKTLEAVIKKRRKTSKSN